MKPLKVCWLYTQSSDLWDTAFFVVEAYGMNRNHHSVSYRSPSWQRHSYVVNVLLG